jgi:hypothetical protein
MADSKLFGSGEDDEAGGGETSGRSLFWDGGARLSGWLWDSWEGSGETTFTTMVSEEIIP